MALETDINPETSTKTLHDPVSDPVSQDFTKLYIPPATDQRPIEYRWVKRHTPGSHGPSYLRVGYSMDSPRERFPDLDSSDESTSSPPTPPIFVYVPEPAADTAASGAAAARAASTAEASEKPYSSHKAKHKHKEKSKNQPLFHRLPDNERVPASLWFLAGNTGQPATGAQLRAQAARERARARRAKERKRGGGAVVEGDGDGKGGGGGGGDRDGGGGGEGGGKKTKKKKKRKYKRLDLQDVLAILCLGDLKLRRND